MVGGHENNPSNNCRPPLVPPSWLCAASAIVGSLCTSQPGAARPAGRTHTAYGPHICQCAPLLCIPPEKCYRRYVDRRLLQARGGGVIAGSSPSCRAAGRQAWASGGAGGYERRSGQGFMARSARCSGLVPRGSFAGCVLRRSACRPQRSPAAKLAGNVRRPGWCEVPLRCLCELALPAGRARRCRSRPRHASLRRAEPLLGNVSRAFQMKLRRNAAHTRKCTHAPSRRDAAKTPRLSEKPSKPAERSAAHLSLGAFTTAYLAPLRVRVACTTTSLLSARHVTSHPWRTAGLFLLLASRLPIVPRASHGAVQRAVLRAPAPSARAVRPSGMRPACRCACWLRAAPARHACRAAVLPAV